MKISELNEHQKVAYQLMDEVTSEYIGGYENQLSDTEGWDDEYNIKMHNEAKEFLEQPHEELKKFVYGCIMDKADLDRGGIDKHIRFAGKEFIMERIEKRLQKWGY